MFAKKRARTDQLLTAVVVLLAAGLCASVYVAFRSDTPTFRDVEPPAAAPEISPAPPAPLTEADLTAVWGARDPEKPSDEAPNTASPAELNGRPTFVVRGIVYSTTGPSVAFIEVAKKLGLYREGQLAEGWRIEKIERGAVTVVSGDARFCMPISAASYAGRPWNPEPQPAVTRTVETDRPSPVVSKTGPDGREQTLQRTIRRAGVPASRSRPPLFPRPENADATVAVPQDLVEKARTDPRSLMDEVKFGFIKDADGRTNGVVLNRVPTGSLAARYGFAPGDRIVAVNGQALTSLAQASRLYDRHRNDSSATVTIERGGVRKNVVYYAR